MIKVMTVVGTRPEVIRLACVIPVLDKYCDHTLVHTGQNYDFELNQVFFEELQIRKPDIFLHAVGNTTAETIGLIIAKTDGALLSIQPDAFLVLGDTNSSLSAIAAKRKKVPIFHMEAGNRSFDQRVPEEINRRIVDHISDVNMPYSTIARSYLLREGLNPDLVIKTGSPMLEVLTRFKSGIDTSDVLNRLGLVRHKYFLVSAHREENIDSDEQFDRFIGILNSLADFYKKPIIVSTHPRTRKKIDDVSPKLAAEVCLLRPLGFFDYVHLQMHAKTVLSDSGTISEESSILNFPALNIRQAHERPEAMEEASVMMVGLDFNLIQSGISILEGQGSKLGFQPEIVADYNVKNVSEKVLRVIISYTDYINRVIWKKSK